MTPHNRYLSPDAPISGAFGVCRNNRSNISFVYSGIIKDRHMNIIKIIVLVILTLGVVFGMLMFLCWVQLIEFLPYNSLVGILILSVVGLILDLCDRYWK
jgi:hypothetical protein